MKDIELFVELTSEEAEVIKGGIWGILDSLLPKEPQYKPPVPKNSPPIDPQKEFIFY